MFFDRLDVDPHLASLRELRGIGLANGLQDAPSIDDRDDWLALLMTCLIEPEIGREKPILVYDYPASQASLAKIRPSDPPVAERFEAYFQGVELANGFHELLDPDEQLRRFEADRQKRRDLGRPDTRPDGRLLAALRAGLPYCSGVALGIDRLLMLELDADSIENVLAFPLGRA